MNGEQFELNKFALKFVSLILKTSSQYRQWWRVLRYLDQRSVARFEEALVRVLIQVCGCGVDGTDPIDGEIRPDLDGRVFIFHHLNARIEEIGISF